MIKSITDLRVNICPTICQTRLRLVGNFLDFAKRARLCVKSALNAWWNFIVSTSNQSHAKHDKRSVFPSYKTCDGVLGYLLREGDSGSVGVGAEDRGAGWVLSDESLGTFPNRGRSGGGGAPSLLLVCKPDQVWQPRSNNHTPLRSRTKHIFILSHDASAAHLDLLFVPRVLQLGSFYPNILQCYNQVLDNISIGSHSFRTTYLKIFLNRQKRRSR